MFVHTVSAPSYSTLVSGIEPSQTGKMTSTLSAQGITYELQNNGTAIAVQSNETAKARVALAGANLLGNTQPGFSLFDKQNLGESNFQQQVTYQRALQGQLDETIDSVQGVSGAQVELVLPSSQNQIFGETQDVSSAAVLLSGTSALAAGSVRGIAQLVSSSVPGLQLEQGHDHRRQRAAAVAAGRRRRRRSGSEVQEAQQRYDQTMEASLDAMLGQTLGAGQGAGARVRQHERQQDEQGIARIRQDRHAHPAEQGHRNADRHGHRRRRRDRHRQPDGRCGRRGGKSNFKHETTTSSLGVDKTVTHSTIAPGAVESQHVSVLLDKSVPASALPAIREAVTNAAGIQTKRGDTISIGQVAFAKSTSAAAPPAAR